METFHGTTILSVRRDGAVALGGDGQVTLGSVVVKATARKVRRLHNDRVLAGFAGATADAFTLFERFEAKLDKHQGQLARAAVELAKDWRSDRILRRLEAMLAVADRSASLIITGTGDVLEPEHGIVAIGSGGPYAQAAARGLLMHTALSATGHRQREPDHRRRALHLHQPAARDRSPGRAAMTAAAADCDVLIAGAGLVGLALAPALARAGLSVALVDHAAVTLPDAPRSGDDWDTRIYAISPGSAAFLRAEGAWQGLAPDRVAPVEAMRVEGDAGARVGFSAYELGERALAWIVEERALREALVPLVHAAGVAVHAPRTFESLSFSRDAADASPRRRRGADCAPARRRRRRALLGSRRGGDRGDDKALRTDRGGRQFRVRARAPRPRPPMVPRGRRHPRVAAACLAGGSRWSGRHPKPARAELAALRAGCARRAGRCGRRACARRTPVHHAGRWLSAAARPAADGDRAPPGARRRRCAWRASAGRPGRQPGLRRRRGAGGDPARARIARRSRLHRSCSTVMRGAAPSRCSRCRPSPTGSRVCSASRRRESGPRATSAWPPSTGCRPPSGCSRSPRCARLPAAPHRRTQ